MVLTRKTEIKSKQKLLGYAAWCGNNSDGKVLAQLPYFIYSKSIGHWRSIWSVQSLMAFVASSSNIAVSG